MGEVLKVGSDVILRELFEELLTKGSRIRFRARGNSMHPVIRDGEFVTIEPVELKDIKVGDILAYQNLENKKIVVHRLVKKRIHCNPSYLIFAGDASPSYDPPVYPSGYLIGKVISLERETGTIDLEGKSNYICGYLRGCLLLFWPCRLARLIWRFIRVLLKLFHSQSTDSLAQGV